MRAIFALFLTFTFASLSHAETKQGWTVSVGMVTNDVYAAEADKPFFPSIRNGTKQTMLIPSLRYQWDNWTIEARGLGWQSSNDNGADVSVNLGYPSSSVSIRDQKGWFRYGGDASVSYASSRFVAAGVTAGPLTFRTRQGFDQQTDQWQNSVAIGAPVFISKNKKAIVIGSIDLIYENTAYSAEAFEYAPSSNNVYRHIKAGAFTVLTVSERTTLLLSADIQWNDSSLLRQATHVPNHQANIFLMLNYYFGR